MSTFSADIQGVGVVRINVIDIARAIAAYSLATGISLEDLTGPSKTPAICGYRHELMWLVRRLDPTASFSIIGRYIGGRDMATVHEAVAKIELRRTNDPVYRDRLDQLIELVKATSTLSRDDLGTAVKPWQLIAAAQVLRDDKMTDAEARKVALGFLQQLEVAHG